MKRKLLLLSIFMSVFAWKGYSQSSSRGYIENAVPAFDNETKELDYSKLEVKPIKLYQPSPLNPPEHRFGNNSAMSVTDNTDVQVFPSTNAQSEQHITVSKVNPNNIILCSNTPNYEGYYVSQDGGTTWFGSDAMPDNQQTFGDPTTSFNSDGAIFMEAISATGGAYKAFKSIDNGNTWPGPVTHTYSPISFDKEMMAIDNLPGSPYLNNIYTAWTDFANTPYRVLFNRSTNNGVSYGANVLLHNDWGQGTNVQTGVNGEVYVCWANYGTGTYPANGIGFSRSLNGGVSFTDLTPVFPYTGIRVNNSGDPLFNNTRVNDFPSMAVDKGCIFFRGRVYIAYAGQQNGNGKGVIYVRSSDDRGTTWTDAMEVSIPTGRQNWFPWITTDASTGMVSVAYLTLDGPSGFTTNTYLAYSFDGGSTWGNIKVSDVSHTVAAIPGFATGYCGDYIGNTAWGNKDYVVWNDNRGGQWNNYVSRVDFSQNVLYSSSTDLSINGPVTHTAPTSNNVQYNAGGNITSPVGTSFATQPGSYVEMFASGHVILNPGFKANSGSHFRALIGSVTTCTNSGHRDEVSDELMEMKKFMKPAYTGDASVQFSFYPNPASHEVNFEYLLPDRDDVTLTISDLQGKQVIDLLNKASQPPGLNHFTYDVSELATGVYVYKLVTGNYVKTGRFAKVD